MVRQFVLPYQLDRATVHFIHPLFRDIGSGMIMQRFVYASYVLYQREHRAYIVRDEDDGRILIDLAQQVVQLRLELLIDVCIHEQVSLLQQAFGSSGGMRSYVVLFFLLVFSLQRVPEASAEFIVRVASAALDFFKVFIYVRILKSVVKR